MKRGKGPTDLAEKVQKLLPARLTVSQMQSRVQGDVATGTVRIYCSSDRKSFLSDFEAKLAKDGEVKDLRLDGQSVRTRRFCED